jgi:hypothetical protein
LFACTKNTTLIKLLSGRREGEEESNKVTCEKQSKAIQHPKTKDLDTVRGFTIFAFTTMRGFFVFPFISYFMLPK